MNKMMVEPTVPAAMIPTGTSSGGRGEKVMSQMFESIIFTTQDKVPVSSSVMIMVPGPKAFHAVQLYVDRKSDSITLLMVSVERTPPPSADGLLCSTVYLSSSVPFSFSHTFSFHAQT